MAQPQTSFDAEFMHDGLFAMAAAYLFHIVQNHPFVDRNKRTGTLATVVFLDINGICLDHPSESLYELTVGVAEGRIDKPAIAAELARIAKEG